ncbi:VOC family protein [Mesorhizobium sp.]|uniref:VOC family protein n=1 Tax=Mesorhizobium sp. TaxID=1871066 RepID=UPI0025E51DC2|nr:VOC family protein [Mesorhizobium sp.]
MRRADDTPGAEPVLVLVDDDVEATIAVLKAGGVEIITEPQEAPWQPGRMVAEFRDSEGNRMVIGSQ